jgi:hypothetical protein
MMGKFRRPALRYRANQEPQKPKKKKEEPKKKEK